MAKVIIRLVSILCVLSLLQVVSANASPYRFLAYGTFDRLVNPINGTLVLEGRITGYGRLKVIFLNSEVKKLYNGFEIISIRGYRISKKGNTPIGATIYRKKHGNALIFYFSSSERNSSRHFKIEVPIGKTNKKNWLGKASSVPSSAFKEIICDEANIGENLQISPDPQTPNTSQASASYKILELSTDMDAEYFSRYGDESYPHIASIINSASAIYEAELNIKLDLVSQHAFQIANQSPFPAPNPTSSELLNLFRGYASRSPYLGVADSYFMFSGKSWSDSSVGIAYVASVCAYPSYSYGLVKGVTALEAAIFAHELGHNVGGSHDTRSTNTIMYPIVSSASTNRFSDFSKQEIFSNLSKSPQCLTTIGSDGAVMTPTTQIVNVRSLQGSLNNRGILLMKLGVSGVSTSCTVNIRSASQRSALRNNKGKEIFSFSPSSLKNKIYIKGIGKPNSNFYVQADSTCGTRKSNILKISTHKLRLKGYRLSQWLNSLSLQRITG